MPGKRVTILDDPQWASIGLGFTLPIQPDSVALGVIDVQYYCIDPSAHLEAHTMQKLNPEVYQQFNRQVGIMVDNIQKLQKIFRSTQRRVFFTRHGSHLRDRADMIPRRRQREINTLEVTSQESGLLPVKGSQGHQLIDEIASLPGELVLDKNTGSAFNSTPIDMFLRNMAIETIVLAGVATEQCVFCTAIDAADRGFNVIIAADACAGLDPGIIEVVLIHFGRISGYVMLTEDIARWLETGQPPERVRLSAPPDVVSE